MLLNHEAILRAYKGKQIIITDEEDGSATTVTDFSGNPFTIDMNLVNAAQAELDKEKYKFRRKQAYPDWGTQLDYIYHNGVDKWKTDIVDPVKTKYPKPS